MLQEGQFTFSGRAGLVIFIRVEQFGQVILFAAFPVGAADDPGRASEGFTDPCFPLRLSFVSQREHLIVRGRFGFVTLIRALHVGQFTWTRDPAVLIGDPRPFSICSDLPFRASLEEHFGHFTDNGRFWLDTVIFTLHFGHVT